MAHSNYYTSPDVERFGRMTLHYDPRTYDVSSSDRTRLRPYHGSYSGRMATPHPQHPQEPETDSPNGSRRRIAVACARCRKRKIKCSGDPGDGRGCENCKMATHQCQFFRVGSDDLDKVIHRDDYHAGFTNAYGADFDTYTHPGARTPSNYSRLTGVPISIATKELSGVSWTYNYDTTTTTAPLATHSHISVPDQQSYNAVYNSYSSPAWTPMTPRSYSDQAAYLRAPTASEHLTYVTSLPVRPSVPADSASVFDTIALQDSLEHTEAPQRYLPVVATPKSSARNIVGPYSSQPDLGSQMPLYATPSYTRNSVTWTAEELYGQPRLAMGPHGLGLTSQEVSDPKARIRKVQTQNNTSSDSSASPPKTKTRTLVMKKPLNSADVVNAASVLTQYASAGAGPGNNSTGYISPKARREKSIGSLTYTFSSDHCAVGHVGSTPSRRTSSGEHLERTQQLPVTVQSQGKSEATRRSNAKPSAKRQPSSKQNS